MKFKSASSNPRVTSLNPPVASSNPRVISSTETEDVYEDFYQDKNLFDFSDYLLNSEVFDPVSKKVIGKMKNECKGNIISEFVGLKSKMYH